VTGGILEILCMLQAFPVGQLRGIFGSFSEHRERYVSI